MRVKRVLLFISIISFIFLASSFLMSDSYAYLANSVSSNTDVGTTNNIYIDTWNLVITWVEGNSYYKGDKVLHNGNTYQAKKDLPTKEPGVDSGWNSQWTQL